MTIVAESKPLANPAQPVGALLRALAGELALLSDLRHQLGDQRAALAADDLGVLEEVLHQLGRTLLTLRETRRQRGLLIELVAGRADAPFAEIAAAIPPDHRPTFDRLRAELNEMAVAANRELVVNQTAIRRAIETGERFLQFLLTGPGPAATSGELPAGGLLLNQRA